MKILCPTPVIWNSKREEKFLARDGAILAKAAATIGYEGVKVILKSDADTTSPKSPLLIAATRAQWADPSFWREQNADAILLYGGFTRWLLPFAKAIHEAGIPLFLKADCANGLMNPLHMPLWLLRKYYWGLRQHHGKGRAFVMAPVRILASALSPHNDFRREYLPLFTGILYEHEWACDNTRKWMKSHGLTECAQRVHTLPHPIHPIYHFDAASPAKEKLIFAVTSDWLDPLKRGPLLFDTLSHFLKRHSDWRAIVLGGNSEAYLKRVPEELRERIQTLPRSGPDVLAPIYEKAAFLAVPSGSESGPNVAFEALASGASVVLTAALRQFRSLEDEAHWQSAIVARSSSIRDFSAAMEEAARRFEQPDAREKALARAAHFREITDPHAQLKLLVKLAGK